MARLAALFFVLLAATGCSFLGAGGLSFDRTELVMDGTSAAVATLTNHGPFAADWEMVFDAAWLSAEPSRGTLAGWAQVDVVIVVDRAYRPLGSDARLERSPGTYLAGVAVRSPRGGDAIDVAFRVREEPTADACEVAPEARRSQDALAHPGDAAPIAPPLAVDAPATHILMKAHDAPNPADPPAFLRDASLEAVARAYGLAPLERGPGRGVHVARVPDGVDARRLVGRLALDPRIAWAELDRPLYPQQVVPHQLAGQAALPNDPALARQWTACRFGLPAAWRTWTGSVPTGTDAAVGTIAVLDSGVDLDHPDLNGRVLPGYDFCPVGGIATAAACTAAAPEPGGEPGSDLHGTHVAGIAAAVGDNGIGIAGVAWGGVQVLPVKVFDDAGSVTSIAALACGIYWAIGSTDPAELCGATPNAHPARILNLSLGGQGTSPTLDAAVAAATARGALVFAATGNGSSIGAHREIFMPANAPDAIAVGSVNSNFERSSFSRFDARGGPTVDLMAPGGYLLRDGSTVVSTTFDDAYGALGGTSMATPFAAGAAALLWTLDPAASSAEIYAQMRATAYFDPAWTAFEYGNGIVCVDAALGLGSRCGMPL